MYQHLDPLAFACTRAHHLHLYYLFLPVIFLPHARNTGPSPPTNLSPPDFNCGGPGVLPFGFAKNGNKIWSEIERYSARARDSIITRYLSWL